MALKEIWVDFNDLDGDMTTSLTKFTNEVLLPGDMVICSDNEDGTDCVGYVEEVRADGAVFIRLDLSTLVNHVGEV